jgi:hypothetical protein
VTSAPLVPLTLGFFVILALGRVAITALSGLVSQGRPPLAHRLMLLLLLLLLLLLPPAAEAHSRAYHCRPAEVST